MHILLRSGDSVSANAYNTQASNSSHLTVLVTTRYPILRSCRGVWFPCRESNSAILDGYSRYIVGYELDQTLDIGFLLQAVTRTLGDRQPEILNSDQGGHFTSEKYLRLLRGSPVRISMDGKGRALDTIFTERFWRSLTYLKYENVYLHDYASPLKG